MGSSIALEKLEHIHKINDGDAREQQKDVADLLERPVTTFPGAQPVSFARKHLIELRKDDYFLCEKTDGIRCLLFLTQIYGENGPQETQFLINRKNEYYHILPGYLHMPLPAKGGGGFDVETRHLGTLLDGELVRQRFKDGRKQLTYLMFDCLAVQGQNIMDRDYGVRIKKMQDLVLNPWKAFAKAWPTEAQVQPFQLAQKDWQMPYATQAMFRDIIPKLPHGNDGLIFTNRNTRYECGTDQHILKWKPPHENTVDFKLQIVGFPVDEDGDEDYEAMPEIELLVFHGGKGKKVYRKFAMLSLTDDEWEAIKGMDQQIDRRIIECYRDAATGNWRPKIEPDGTPRYRDDKQDANHITVVESVLESIEDAVTEEDLNAMYEPVRTAYKERERQQKERMKQQMQQQQAEQQRKRAQMAEQQEAQRRMAQQGQQNRPARQEEQPGQSADDDDDVPGYTD